MSTPKGGKKYFEAMGRSHFARLGFIPKDNCEQWPEWAVGAFRWGAEMQKRESIRHWDRRNAPSIKALAQRLAAESMRPANAT